MINTFLEEVFMYLYCIFIRDCKKYVKYYGQEGSKDDLNSNPVDMYLQMHSQDANVVNKLTAIIKAHNRIIHTDDADVITEDLIRDLINRSRELKTELMQVEEPIDEHEAKMQDALKDLLNRFSIDETDIEPCGDSKT